MRAAVRTRYGGPEVIRFVEVPEPVTARFGELRDAYAYVDSGRKVGTVVVTIP